MHKIITVLLSLWTISLNAFSQPQLAAEQIIANGMGGFFEVTAADMDGDGDLDIVSSSHFEDEILWYINDGSGQFVGTDTIATGLTGSLNSYAVFDVDMDNDQDVVVPYGNTFFWYENDGSGSSFTQHTISNGLIDVKDIEYGDIDNDGDLDFVMVSYWAGTGSGTKWFKNDGSGNFTMSGYLQGYFTSVGLADLNGDGRLDLIRGDANELSWRIGDGNTFYGQQTLPSSAHFVRSVISGDVDNDNDLDVIAAFSTGGGQIVVFENDGNGTFSSNTVIGSPGGVLDTADVDNDGDLDILSTLAGEQEVVWFENDGNGGFSTQQSVAEDIAYGGFVHASDIDDDGSVDAVFCSRTEVGWAKNQSGVFDEALVSSRIDSVQEIYSYDLNNDGDNDVIASTGAYGQSSIYFENLGGGTFAPQRVFYSSIKGTQFFTKVDNDQYLDMVFNRNGFLWAENDGTAHFGTPQSIAGYRWNDEIIDVTDINGDTQPDILIRASDDSIVWVSNVAASNGVRNFAAQIPNYCCYETECQDMDGDGDKDLFLYRVSGSLMQWYENNGSGSFTGPIQIDDIEMSYGDPARLIDINNDNRMDVVASDGDTLFWYMNTPQGFSSPQFIDANTGPNNLFALDVDLDNHTDIVYSTFGGAIRWFQNTGNGSFEPDSLVISLTKPARKVILSDMDGDDRADLIAGGTQLLSWFGNLNEPAGIIDAEQEGEQGIFIYPNPATSNIMVRSETPLSQLKLTDLSGRVAWQEALRSVQRSQTIDISSLRSGIYLVEAIAQQGGRYVQKVVIQ